MSLLVMFFGFWSCLVYFENCEIFEIKVRDEFTLKRNSYTYIYIYIFTASVVKRARMLINSIGSSWEGFGWTIGTILVRRCPSSCKVHYSTDPLPGHYQ